MKMTTNQHRQLSALVIILFALLIGSTSVIVGIHAGDVPLDDLQKLEQVAFSEPPESPRSLQLWQQILQRYPRSLNANIQVGLKLISSPKFPDQAKGIHHLEKALYARHVDNPISLETMQGALLASTVGRWYWERKEFAAAKRYTQAVSTRQPNDLCMAAMSATIIDTFPSSLQAADQSIERYLDLTERLINRLNTTNWRIDEEMLSRMFPGAGPDPYVHCMATIFHLSFFYRPDIALVANRHYQIASKIWPDLSYTTKKAKKWMQSGRQKTHREGTIRLGIASGCFSPSHSVVADFYGVMSRLDRRKFNVTYIYLNERNTPIDTFVYTHPQDKVIILRKEESDFADGSWVKRYHPIVESLDLDILFYPDLTMSTHAQRLAFAKLAPVQATSHGHPVTSGIPKDIMDYYISWGAAELEYETAKTHYSEALKFLPTKTLHQFYTPRSDERRSLLDRGDYRSLVDAGRASTFKSIPPDGHWYTCMQKPHKFHPEMDELICKILAKDPLGRAILHKVDDSKANHDIFTQRLTREGCDMSRVHFLEAQLHHRLLALYALSDVILDSYPAGGCTTTREVLGLGKAVVTLPARLLGSRWSFAYYQMLGDEEINAKVVAQSPLEYVDLAVQLGTNEEKRIEVERRIKGSIHKLYEKWESITAWENVFLEIAPVTIRPQEEKEEL